MTMMDGETVEPPAESDIAEVGAAVDAKASVGNEAQEDEDDPVSFGEQGRMLAQLGNGTVRYARLGQEATQQR